MNEPEYVNVPIPAAWLNSLTELARFGHLTEVEVLYDLIVDAVLGFRRRDFESWPHQACDLAFDADGVHLNTMNSDGLES